MPPGQVADPAADPRPRPPGCRARAPRPCPALGWRKPSSSRIVVLLPAPFGPRNPKISPTFTWIDRSVRAATSAAARQRVPDGRGRSACVRPSVWSASTAEGYTRLTRRSPEAGVCGADLGRGPWPHRVESALVPSGDFAAGRGWPMVLACPTGEAPCPCPPGTPPSPRPRDPAAPSPGRAALAQRESDVAGPAWRSSACSWRRCRSRRRSRRRSHRRWSRPAPARREPIVFYGRGYGHGVGMSQYGARGRALIGQDAATILAHYYPGTTLGTTDPKRPVRILVLQAFKPSPRSRCGCTVGADRGRSTGSTGSSRPTPSSG